ncbi:MAG: diacylglycerol kinase family protein [Candidatus Nanopelagicales bacterium]
MQPFLLVNAGSGGGETQDSIVAAAEELHVECHEVQPGDDFDEVLTAALDRGADLLIAAGGDGTLCAVADQAMAHDVPMIVVPAGTRNHFALDVGLDLDDPVAVFRASLTSGHERSVDVGSVNGATFLNNASLGVYASAVGEDDYRDHKVKALVGAARKSVSKDDGGQAHLSTAVPGSALEDLGEAAPAVMVVNNAYSPTFSPGARLRPRLDSGEVWVYIGGGMERGENLVASLAHAVDAAITKQTLRAAFGAERVVISSDTPEVPIAVDGEHRPDLTAPFEFRSRKGALRLIVPDDPAPREVQILLSW